MTNAADNTFDLIRAEIEKPENREVFTTQNPLTHGLSLVGIHFSDIFHALSNIQLLLHSRALGLKREESIHANQTDLAIVDKLCDRIGSSWMRTTGSNQELSTLFNMEFRAYKHLMLFFAHFFDDWENVETQITAFTRQFGSRAELIEEEGKPLRSRVSTIFQKLRHMSKAVKTVNMNWKKIPGSSQMPATRDFWLKLGEVLVSINHNVSTKPVPRSAPTPPSSQRTRKAGPGGSKPSC